MEQQLESVKKKKKAPSSYLVPSAPFIEISTSSSLGRKNAYKIQPITEEQVLKGEFGAEINYMLPHLIHHDFIDF
jgi:hypothetical protein